MFKQEHETRYWLLVGSGLLIYGILLTGLMQELQNNNKTPRPKEPPHAERSAPGQLTQDQGVSDSTVALVDTSLITTTSIDLGTFDLGSFQISILGDTLITKDKEGRIVNYAIMGSDGVYRSVSPEELKRLQAQQQKSAASPSPPPTESLPGR